MANSKPEQTQHLASIHSERPGVFGDTAGGGEIDPLLCACASPLSLPPSRPEFKIDNIDQRVTADVADFSDQARGIAHGSPPLASPRPAPRRGGLQ